MQPTLPTTAYLRLIPSPRCTGPRYPVAVPRGLQLCYSDAYAWSVEARVLAVDFDSNKRLRIELVGE